MKRKKEKPLRSLVSYSFPSSLTSLKIWIRPPCYSNRHRNHLDVFRIFRIAIPTLHTTVRVAKRMQRQYRHSNRTCNILECIDPPHRNIYTNCCQQHRKFVQASDLFQTMPYECQNLNRTETVNIILLFTPNGVTSMFSHQLHSMRP